MPHLNIVTGEGIAPEFFNPVAGTASDICTENHGLCIVCNLKHHGAVICQVGTHFIHPVFIGVEHKHIKTAQGKSITGVDIMQILGIFCQGKECFVYIKLVPFLCLCFIFLIIQINRINIFDDNSTWIGVDFIKCADMVRMRMCQNPGIHGFSFFLNNGADLGSIRTPAAVYDNQTTLCGFNGVKHCLISGVICILCNIIALRTHVVGNISIQKQQKQN